MNTWPTKAVWSDSDGAAGGSLTAATVSVNVVDAEAGGSPSSAAVTRMVSVAGVSGSKGAPLNVRVAGLKLNHAGRAPPSSSIAV